MTPAAPQRGSLAEDEVRARVEEVLARPEFQPPAGSLADWILEKLGELFDRLGFDFEADGLPLEMLLYLLLALATAALIALVVRALVRLRRERARGERGTPGAEELRRRRVDALRAEAAAAAAAGDRVRALRLYFTALVIGLSDRGDLEYRDAWTTRERFERGRPRSDAARELATLAPELDRKSFGGEPAAEADVERLRDLCDRWLGRAA